MVDPARRPPLTLAAGGEGGPPTHADLLKAIMAVDRKSDHTAEQLLLHAGTMQRVESKLGEYLTKVGAEGMDEHGKAVGTGLAGRLMRLEDRVRARFRLYDDLRNFAIGFGMAASIFIGALWWVLGDKVGHLLK